MTNELIEQRSKAAKYMRDLQAKLTSEKRQMDAEEKTKYQNCLAEINEIDEQDKRNKEIADIDARGAMLEKVEKREFTPEAGKPADAKLSVEERKTADIADFREFMMNGQSTNTRAMTTATGATGGYMIPEVLSNQLYEYAKDDSIIRQLATVTNWKGDGAFPCVTDFGTAYLVAEASQVTTTNATIANSQVSGFQLMYRTEVPQKLINTSQYPVESKLMGWWGKAKSNKEESLLAVGAGTTEPYGVTILATNGSETAANSAISAVDVIDWYYDVPFTYRKNSSWIFADATIKLIRQITNAVTTSGANNFVWVPGLGGESDTLMGRPIYPSAGMNAFAADTEIGVFGDISQYQVVDFGAPQMIKDIYSVATYGQVRFVGWQLVDAALPVAEAIVSCRVIA